MFEFDKILSFVVLASLVGAVLAPVAGMVAKPGPGATQFMLGLLGGAGFLIALALAMGVIANNTRARNED